MQLNLPKLSKWRCELFGVGQNGIVFTPCYGKEPNAFWCWMQWFLLGNRWYKVK